MTKLDILFQNDGSKTDTMSLRTHAMRNKAYNLAREYIKDCVEKNFQFIPFDKTDTSGWIDGTSDPEAIRNKALAWNQNIRNRFQDSLARISDKTNPPLSSDYGEHAAASCEIADTIIHGCRHLIFIRDEYNCCYTQTMLTENDIRVINNRPQDFCCITLEYY